MLESGLPEQVADGEPIARFVFNKKHVYATGDAVKPAAVYPNKDGETSVSRVIGLLPAGTAELARECERLRTDGKTLLGHIEFLQLKVNQAELDNNPDEPPVRHANIIGWPDTNELTKRSELKSKAQILTELAPYRPIEDLESSE